MFDYQNIDYNQINNSYNIFNDKIKNYIHFIKKKIQNGEYEYMT